MNLNRSWVCALALAAACADSNDIPFADADGDGVNDNDPEALRTFTMRVENVVPYKLLKSSVQRTRPDKTDGNLAPGQYYEIRFTAGFGHRLTLASMLFESNDWFFGTDTPGVPLYTNGVPLSGDITHLLYLWDAGTEADEEPGVGGNTGIKQITRTAGSPDGDNRVRLVPDVVTLANGGQFVRPAVSSMIRATLTSGADRQFVLRIENVSTTETLVTSAGTMPITVTPVLWIITFNPAIIFDANAPQRGNGLEALAEGANADSLNEGLRLTRGIASPVSGGVYVVHAGDMPLFTEASEDRGTGLEALAEDGATTNLMASLNSNSVPGVDSYGSFEKPVDADANAPCRPGQAFELTFKARPGDRLSFAASFLAANDWFISAPGAGMPLFNGNLPRWGEITNEFRIFDLGTESDEELDVGANVGTQQQAGNLGRIDRDINVREVGRDRYDVPITRHVRVTLTPPMK